MLTFLSRRHSSKCLFKASLFLLPCLVFYPCGFSIKAKLDIGNLLPELLFLSRAASFRYRKGKRCHVKQVLKILTDNGGRYSFSHLWALGSIENQTKKLLCWLTSRLKVKGLMWAPPPPCKLKKPAYLMACKPVKMTKLPMDCGSGVAVLCSA